MMAVKTGGYSLIVFLKYNFFAVSPLDLYTIMQ